MAATSATRPSYQCTEGHVVSATAPLGACPVVVLGMPCRGVLRPISRNKAADLFANPIPRRPAR